MAFEPPLSTQELRQLDDLLNRYASQEVPPTNTPWGQVSQDDFRRVSAHVADTVRQSEAPKFEAGP